MLPQPSLEGLSRILRTCSKEKKVAFALHLVSYAITTGIEAHSSLGTPLIAVLVELRCLCHAHRVFDKMCHPQASSWSSLIIGYVKSGDPVQAMALYEKYSCDFPCPNVFMFVALAKACSDLKDVDTGQKIHAQISKNHMLQKNLFLGNTLIDMYVKCGVLSTARDVLYELPIRDVISWTSMIAGYASHEHGEDALDCFEEMLCEGVLPNSVTYASALKACGILHALDQGQKIYAEIVRKKNMDFNPAVGSALVDMYVNCGLPDRAQEVFDRLEVRNVVTWTVLITGYVKHERAEKALHCYDQMCIEGITPNSVTYICVLKACGLLEAADKGSHIHNELIREKLLEKDQNVGNAVVDMYAKCGCLAKAQEVFGELPHRDAISWNSLIAGYAKHEHGEEVINFFSEMQLQGIVPDAVTCVCSLKASGDLEMLAQGRVLHAEIARRHLSNKNPAINIALVDMYAKCGSFARAQEIFKKLPERNVVVWTALIGGYVKHGYWEEALKCFEQMQTEGFSPDAITLICSLKACGSIEAMDKVTRVHAQISRQGLIDKNLNIGNALVDTYAKIGLVEEAQEVFDRLPLHSVVSWTSLIAGYAKLEYAKEALKSFEQMQRAGFSPDATTFVCVLNACAIIGAIERGKAIHAQIDRQMSLRGDIAISNALIDMYAKFGLVKEARELFDLLQVHDIISWTSLIAGYAKLGESTNVFSILERMLDEGADPDEVTFTSVMSACSHAGFVSRGETWYEVMSKEYGITPSFELLSCMVDLFSRAGHLDKAMIVLKEITVHPNHAAWRSVLEACRKSGNLELGKRTFQNAAESSVMDHALNSHYLCHSVSPIMQMLTCQS